MKPIRVVFQAHNRRGLGHLMRGLNIARELRLLVPSAEILFYVKNRSAELLCGREFHCVVETEPPGLGHWAEVIRGFAPDVVVYDTLLPKEPTLAACATPTRSIYIMRQCQEVRQQEIFGNPVLAQIDRILIPHTPAEFAYQIPEALKPKSFFVGQIVRPLRPETQEGLRREYGLSAKNFLLISTVGGGGFAEQAAAFFATVFAVHQRVYPHLPHLQHLVIQGPNFRHSHPSFSGHPGLTVIAYEPELSNLFALANLVIAEGGYNTVTEIRLAQTPAIFLPSKRNYDNQAERVRALQQRGLALVFTEPRAEQIAQSIVEFAASAQQGSEIRARYATDRLEPGNRVAAEKILEVLAA